MGERLTKSLRERSQAGVSIFATQFSNYLAASGAGKPMDRSEFKPATYSL
jgi:hypothetical protein